MRGRIDGLPNPLPLEEALPEVYRQEPLTSSLMAVFDDALTPVLAVLDNLEAYFDPGLAPRDFVAWLGTWFDLTPNTNWELQARRERIRRAVEFFTWSGTAAGMRSYIAVYFNVDDADVEIHEDGGVTASTTSRGDVTGSPEPALTVRVRLLDPSPDDAERLDNIVAAIKPAHLVHRVEVVGR